MQFDIRSYQDHFPLAAKRYALAVAFSKHPEAYGLPDRWPMRETPTWKPVQRQAPAPRPSASDRDAALQHAEETCDRLDLAARDMVEALKDYALRAAEGRPLAALAQSNDPEPQLPTLDPAQYLPRMIELHLASRANEAAMRNLVQVVSEGGFNVPDAGVMGRKTVRWVVGRAAERRLSEAMAFAKADMALDSALTGLISAGNRVFIANAALTPPFHNIHDTFEVQGAPSRAVGARWGGEALTAVNYRGLAVEAQALHELRADTAFLGLSPKRSAKLVQLFERRVGNHFAGLKRSMLPLIVDRSLHQAADVDLTAAPSEMAFGREQLHSLA